VVVDSGRDERRLGRSNGSDSLFTVVHPANAVEASATKAGASAAVFNLSTSFVAFLGDPFQVTLITTGPRPAEPLPFVRSSRQKA
jgi:hypothetical protein